jgi:hypothetical protein
MPRASRANGVPVVETRETARGPMDLAGFVDHSLQAMKMFRFLTVKTQPWRALGGFP